MGRTMRSGEDGPLYFALLLGNQNNNNGNNGANNSQNPGQTQEKKPEKGTQKPATDSIRVLPSSVVLEYAPQYETPLPSAQNFGCLRVVGHVAKQERTKDVCHTAHDLNKEHTDPGLSAEQLGFWKRNGYLVIKDALQPIQLSNMRSSLMTVLERLSDDKDSARKQHHITSDNRSEHGTCPVNPNGRVIATIMDDPTDEELDSLQRIRRVGSGLHRILPAFRSVTFSRVNQNIATLLGLEDPRVTQGIVITKPRGVGSECIPHQDGCSSFTDPPSAITFWYALQDTSVENGCLKVVPGSHKTEPLTMRTRLSKNGFAEIFHLPEPIYAKEKELETDIADNAAPPIQLGPEGEYFFQPLEVKAGTLILMHSNLVHASDANRSNTNRLAYNFGVVEGKLPWPQDAYLQPYEGHSEFEKLEPKM